jgi:hypothetical protein
MSGCAAPFLNQNVRCDKVELMVIAKFFSTFCCRPLGGNCTNKNNPSYVHNVYYVKS